jgi:hypothetical protein
MKSMKNNLSNDPRYETEYFFFRKFPHLSRLSLLQYYYDDEDCIQEEEEEEETGPGRWGRVVVLLRGTACTISLTRGRFTALKFLKQ